MPVPVQPLADWHFRAGALERLMPAFAQAKVLEHPGAIAEGAVTRLQVRALGFPVEWVARHHDVLPGRGFSDTQVSGPFARWSHRHSFLPEGPAASLMEDRVEYELPGGSLGRLLGGGYAESELARLFAWRHARLRHDLHHHRRFLGEHLRVAVSGSSGMIGRAFVPFLTAAGHDVRRIVRGTANHERGEIAWDTRTDTFDARALEGLDAVVHLAGAGVADERWTPARKEILRRSRIDSTLALAKTLASLRSPPRVLVCASATGFYGNRGPQDPVDEASAPGSGFLAELCQAWERATDAARAAGIRVVHVRVSMVIGADGGVLAKLAGQFRAGVGGPVGSGKQGVSWIAQDDLLGILRFVMSEPIEGPVNAVAPEPTDNRGFARALGAAVGRPAIAPVPGMVVKLAFGEMGERLVLEGSFVRPRVLRERGFEWVLPNLEQACRFELGRMA